MAELNELSLDVSFVEHKVVRVIDKVEFHIKTRKHHKTQQLRLPMSEAIAGPEKPKALPKPQLTKMQQKVVARMSKLKLTEAQVRKILAVITTEADLTKLLKKTYPILRDFETKARPGENVTAATMALPKRAFPVIWAAS